VRIRKTATAAKDAANKKNAENSTGPTSARGKRISIQNAISHGMYTSNVLLPGESQNEFRNLQSEMMNSYCPVGSRELRRVEKLVWNEWRHRRLRRGEAGELARLLADHDTRAEMLACTHTPLYNQAVSDLGRLTQIEEQVKMGGRISQENLDWLRNLPYIGGEGRSLWDAIDLAQTAKAKEGASPSPEDPTAEPSQRPTRAKSTVTSEVDRDIAIYSLSALDSLKQAMRREQWYHAQYLIRRAEAQRDALLLPQETLLNRTTRCESHLLRNIERDENALERMQRLRRGDKVPAPTARID
jgi:hypothetical protein